MGPRHASLGFTPIQGSPGLPEMLTENADGSSGFTLWLAVSQGWWSSSAKSIVQFSSWLPLLTLKNNLTG